MKKVRLSEIHRKPRYLVEFPLLGKTIAPVATIKPVESDFRIDNPGMMPPFADKLRNDSVYAIADNESTAEVKVIHRDANGAIVSPLTDEDRLTIASMQPNAICELTIVRVRESDFLSVPERLEFQRVLSAIASLRKNPDYNFTSKFLQSVIETDETRSSIESADADDREEIRQSIMIAALDDRTEDEMKRSARDEELSIEMLDLSRQQLEILGGLKPGTLAELSMDSVQSILGTINAPEENESAIDESGPESESKPKRGRPPKKESQPLAS